MVRNYHDMEIFQLAYTFVIALYPYVDKFPENEHKNLVLQMKRAAISLPLNIVEGSSRRSDREFLAFLGYAFGSARELEVLLDLSKDFGFLDEDGHAVLSEDLQKFTFKLISFMRNIEQRLPLRKDVALIKMSRGESPWKREPSTNNGVDSL